MSIVEEIRILANDLECLRLNFLTQTNSRFCFICNDPNRQNRLTLKSRIDIFLKRNIYHLEHTRCCIDHLNGQGLLLDGFLEGLRYFDRPIILRGPELQSFLRCLREQAVNRVNERYDNETHFNDE